MESDMSIFSPSSVADSKNDTMISEVFRVMIIIVMLY